MPVRRLTLVAVDETGQTPSKRTARPVEVKMRDPGLPVKGVIRRDLAEMGPR